MVSVTQSRLMTAEEFMDADLGEGRFELVRGEVVAMPPPMPEHGRVVVNVGFVLESYGRHSGSGYCLSESAVPTERGPDTVRGPEICFYRQARWPRSQVGNTLPPVPPDLAVEVVSPRNRPGELLRKVGEYREAGVPLVWLVYPKRRRVTVYRPEEEEPKILEAGGILEGFPELPGFRCPVADLFI